MTHDTLACPVNGAENKQCLQRRTDIAKEKGADILVSIHNNYSASSSARGCCVYYPNYNWRPYLAVTGKGVASSILSKLTSLGLVNGGVMYRNCTDNSRYPDNSLYDYYKIIYAGKENNVAGIIVEHAYQSSPSDVANFLNTDAKLQRLGQADGAGIAEYFGLNYTTYKGVDYKDVYDPDYYYNNNPDVAAAVGTDRKALVAHFVNYGMNEGRQAIATFDPYVYKGKYSDLKKAYGNGMKNYYLHYMLYGKNEGRVGILNTGGSSGTNYTVSFYYNNTLICTRTAKYGHGVTAPEIGSAFLTYTPDTDISCITGNTTVHGTVNYICNNWNYGTGISKVFNANYYSSKYSDLKSKFGTNEWELLKHFVNYGMSEGRVACSNFNMISYKNRYVDLRLAYGMNYREYYHHYMRSGQSKGRIATGCETKVLDPVCMYNNKYMYGVYNYEYYLEHNADVKAAFGYDDIGALEHFVTYGMKEGRRGNEEFDVAKYKARYSDLRKAFKNDLASYYWHYLKNGITENRIAN